MTGADRGLDVPYISVIIPAFNAAATLAACLDAVGDSDYSSFEVIVVDDGSTDDTAEIARRSGCRPVKLPANVGPAAARNAGAASACGAILFFLDADILVAPSTLRRIAGTFVATSTISAAFGSYRKDTIPSNFWSVYKNLVHHFTHQTARQDAVTFCAGFGAIRRDVFESIGGFDEGRRWIEDIELGHRLHLAGHAIHLDKQLLTTHMKIYSFRGLLRSEVIGRAIPWTCLMLQTRVVRSDLNTRWHNVLSVQVAFAMIGGLATGLVWPWLWLALPPLGLLFVALNLAFYRFLLRERGWLFTLKVIPVSWFTYVYSGAGLIIGIAAFIRMTWHGRR